MRLLILRETYHAGKPVKAGDVVDAIDADAANLLSSYAAREASAEDLSAPAAPVIETAQANPESETATTRPAKRRG